ncbi:MAG: hypothetical protein IJW40_09770 [Clostridia bacterium]|nr:hypothetical protein [Clostridia bacterium]
MNENRTLNELLQEIEQDNVDLLSEADASHRFSFAFERRALAVCRGAYAEHHRSVRRRSRRIPLWVAVILVLLAAALVTGCAVVISRYFTRYIPFYGVVESGSMAVMYSTTEPISTPTLEIETLLYVKEGERCRLMLWGVTKNGKFLHDEIVSVRIGDITYSLICSQSYGSATVHEIYAEAEGAAPAANQAPPFTLFVDGQSMPLNMTDISSQGYTVDQWIQINDLTVKILPLYTNNRIFILETAGLENAMISGSIVVYDSLGNSIRSNGASTYDDRMYTVTCEENLPGDIVKIELANLRIRRTVPMQSCSIPLSLGRTECNITLFETDIMREVLTAVEYDGTNVKLHTVAALKDGVLQSGVFCDEVRVDYQLDLTADMSWDLHYEDLRYGEVGKHLYTYEITLSEPADKLNISADHYVYMLHGEDGTLGEILVEKQ